MRQRRRIGVYGICHDGSGRVLLARASSHSGRAGKWQVPGGGVDHGEDPLDALGREFAEETGLTVRPVRLVGVRFELVAEPWRDELIHHDRIVFEVEVTGGTLRPEADGSSDAVDWFGPEELPHLSIMRWSARLLGLVEDDPAWAEADRAAVAASTPVPPAPDTARFQRFSAYGLVTDPAGRLLLTRIADGYPGAGTWHLPGGGTDFGESAAEGLLRELREETGQVGAVGELLSVAHLHSPSAYGPERRSLDWHTVRSIFRVAVAEPTEPVVHEANGSTDAVAWFTPGEVWRLNLNRLARTVISDYGQ
ncbi:MAG TPA: NUDIX domain-containing protein [Micromonosporaceae bacterium]|nr:NUDIX domain-containing protein [Micromonosporaceae bacterium]